jgi:hypothetical protein
MKKIAREYDSSDDDYVLISALTGTVTLEMILGWWIAVLLST